ncbi:unnamed protein product [Phytophthora fragariaefolia]|uniref:Unnamed protein product n=1 Tax=Phytophthora fragariaefolia TaxID=1490495 RepID=A0A9W7D6D2_9STRA|nr:unnamed protein product [Phytophthora fragariaefolia]
MASVAASLGGAWSHPVKSSLPFSLTSTSRSLVLRRAELARRCGSPPADTAPAVSPTTAPPLASSAAETAGPNSPPSSGQPGGQASTSLTPPSAPRAGAESASAGSPTPVTAESSTEPVDSAVGSTSPPLSSASSAPSQPTSVSLGLRNGADDSLSSPPEPRSSEARGVLAGSSFAESAVHFAVCAKLGFPRWLAPKLNRCWDQVMGSCLVEIQKEIVDGKTRVRSTPSSLSGLAAFADVYAAQHPSQRFRAMFPNGAFFMSAGVLRRVRARRSSPKSDPLVEIVAECWLKYRGDRQGMAKVLVALYERMHWLVDSSVVLGLQPDLNPTSSADELALAYPLWQNGEQHPAPQLDSELYFDPSVPFAPPANLPWFPTSADWCEAVADIDVGEPWLAWWLRVPELHPYNMYFRPRHPGFPVFGSAESDLSQAQRLVDEDGDLAESAPPTRSPSAPTPANREGLDIFGSSEASPDVTL